MTTADEQRTIDELRAELAQAKKQIHSLRISVRAEEMKVRISSEYTNFGLWEYDISEDIMYQYKKLHGKYEKNLEPIIGFRTSVISWGTVNVSDLPVFNAFCDALERGDKEMGCDVRVLNDSSEMVWFRYEGKTVYDESGKPLRVIGRTLDVTAEKGGTDPRDDERHDPVTGVYRKDTFKELVGRFTSGEDVYKNSALILVGVRGISNLRSESRCYVMSTIGKTLTGIAACYHESIVGLTDSEEFGFFTRFTDMPSLEGIARQIYDTINGFDRFISEEYSGVFVNTGIAIIKAESVLIPPMARQEPRFARRTLRRWAAFITTRQCLQKPEYPNRQRRARQCSLTIRRRFWGLLCPRWLTGRIRPRLWDARFRLRAAVWACRA